MPDPLEGFLTTRQLAEALGVTVARVRQLATRRGVEPAAIVGTAHLWRRSAVEALRPGPRGWPKGKPRGPKPSV